MNETYLRKAQLLQKMREKMVKRILEIEREHFIPMHREKKEDLEEKEDVALKRYLRALEIMHLEWAVGGGKNLGFE
tara:strand:+ start:5762 stop:5989 length:228 start_codon:yes stop_codon:yes gene_type:complete